MTTPAFYYGTGRRKTAVARVRLIPGSGEIVVNDRSLEAHFGNAIGEANVRLPFRVTGTEGTFNAQIKVEGGGVTGQTGAIRHSIARALLQRDPEGNRFPLRKAGLLTRAPRMKERKKYGLKRARKAPQYTKRGVDGRPTGRPHCLQQLRASDERRSLRPLPGGTPGRPRGGPAWQARGCRGLVSRGCRARERSRRAAHRARLRRAPARPAGPGPRQLRRGARAGARG